LIAVCRASVAMTALLALGKIGDNVGVAITRDPLVVVVRPSRDLSKSTIVVGPHINLHKQTSVYSLVANKQIGTDLDFICSLRRDWSRKSML
jgi:hypothetical protein